MKSRVTKFLLYLVLGLIVLCAGMIGFLALSNRSLPTHSKEVDRLFDLERARLAEAIRLREITPEAFTVLVGDRWVASMRTKEYALVYFVNDFGEQLPPILRPVFPYRLMFGQLMGETENSIGSLEHESFHAFQGDVVPQRLEAAEEVMRICFSKPSSDPG